MNKDIDLEFDTDIISCFQIRQNVVMDRSFFDMNDPLLVEGPAKGAHSEYVFWAQQ